MPFQSSAQFGISVLIVSNRSTETVRAAIDSIAAQDYDGRIHVVVIGDNSEWKNDDLITDLPDRFLLETFSVSTSTSFNMLPTVARVARFRNMAIAARNGRYVCFLDDDNRWESDHLSSLVATIEASEAVGVHSWRRLVDPSGNDWFADRFPWGRDAIRSAQLFDLLCGANVMAKGSHLFRDRAHLSPNGEILGAVDMGAWLFRSEFFESERFAIEYSEWEIENSVTEDDKLLASIMTANVPIACSSRPTLIYRLGGYSNVESSKGLTGQDNV